jgi:hypothetical protein
MQQQSSIFWDITLCSSLKVNQRFGGTCRLHVQDRISQARNRHEAGSKQSSGFLLDLFFDLEDDGEMLLRNAS